MARKSQTILSINCGGSKLRIAEVNYVNGKILDSLEIRVSEFKAEDKEKFTKRVVEETDRFYRSRKKFGLASKNLGYTSAGVVDEENLKIVFAANLPFLPDAPKALKDQGYEVVLINDMVAEATAIGTFGDAKDLNLFSMINAGSGGNGIKGERKKDKLIFRDRPELGVRLWTPNFEVRYPPSGNFFESYFSVHGALSMVRGAFQNPKEELDQSIIYNALIRLKFDQNIQDEVIKTIRKIPLKDLSDQTSRFTDYLLSRLDIDDLWTAYLKNPDKQPQKSIIDTVIRSLAHFQGDFILSYKPTGPIFYKGGLVDATRRVKYQDSKVSTGLIKMMDKLYRIRPEEFQRVGDSVIKVPETYITQLKRSGLLGAGRYAHEFLEKQ